MNITPTVQELWSRIQALPADQQRWLADKLYEEVEEKEKEQLTPYTMEEINDWIDDFEAELEAGEPGYTLEEFDTRMRKEHGWL